MNYDQYVKEMNMLITAYHERIETPHIEKLNQAHKIRIEKKNQNIKDYFASLEEWGINAQKLSKDWKQRQRDSMNFKNQCIPQVPDWLKLAHKDCRDISRILRLQGYRLGPYQLIQPELLYTKEFSTKKLNKLEPSPDFRKLFEVKESKTKRTRWPGPVNFRVESINSTEGVEDIEERSRSYFFITPQGRTSPYYIFLKWDSLGLYWLYSKCHANYRSKARISIKAEVHIGQFHKGAYFHHLLTHNILFKEGEEIKESDWVPSAGYGSNVVTWTRHLFPDTPTFYAVVVTFETYSKLDAYAIIDCDNTSNGTDFWFNFNVLML